MADAAGPPALVLGADRLRGVLDDHEAVLVSHPHHSIHVGHLTIEVDRDDCARPARHLRLHFGGIEIVGGGIDVDEDRCRSDARDRAGRREERVRSCDDLVPGTDVFRHQAGE